MHSSSPFQPYQLQYTSSNGAQIWCHPLHGSKEVEENIVIARFLADYLGESIKLLPSSSEPGSKNPDAEIKGELWEFKTNYAATGTSVDSSIRDAQRKAPNILLYFTKSMLPIDLENALYGRVHKYSHLLRIRIIHNGQLYEFNRTDIVSQQFRGLIKGEGSPA